MMHFTVDRDDKEEAILDVEEEWIRIREMYSFMPFARKYLGSPGEGGSNG